MRLAIADPPYPPILRADGTSVPRASRWYGNNQQGRTDVPADRHDDAAEWDDRARHRRLLLELLDAYDGFAIATSPDGIAAYAPLPAPIHLLAWVRRHAQPGNGRLHSLWEAVLLYPPEGRRSNRNGVGSVPDVLIYDAPRGFIGAKPMQWTHWVLDAMSYDAETDTVYDLFPGSGAVRVALAQDRLSIAGPV